MDKRLISAAESTLRRVGLLHKRATVLVALSGGADSVALLFTMHALHETYGLAVLAAHVEHGLRGEASLADAAFCEDVCKRLHVPFTCEHASLSGTMDTKGIEAAARDARYTLLLARAKASGADAIALAHHQDDQAETVLQHLLRGSGARGLRGMEEITVRDGMVLLRPFLSLPKQALLDALGDTPYRTDASNLSPVCQRNRIRQDVLPRLIQENPAAIAHIARSAALLTMDEACLQKLSDTLLQNALIDKAPYFCLHREALLKQDDAVALRVLRSFAEIALTKSHAKPDERTLSADDSMALLQLLSAPESTVINLPGALHASTSERFIHITHMEGDELLQDIPLLPPKALDTESGTIAFGDIRIQMMPYAHGGICPDGKRTVVLPHRLLASAVLRQPETGDTIHPFGADGKKPLRRYLTDQKLDAPFRKHLPVIVNGRDVLWVIGIGAAESTRTVHEPSVLLTLQGTLPWYNINH